MMRKYFAHILMIFVEKFAFFIHILLLGLPECINMYN